MQEKPRILIVDDEKTNLQLLIDLLAVDFKVLVAKNGETALNRLEGDHLPDLILLDIIMPGIDGFEVCQHIKSNEGLKNIPVIFLSAKNSPEDEQKGIALGAVDFISKPMTPCLVLIRIKSHLELAYYRKKYADGS